MTAILGISAFYHDAAAALVVDGRIVAAAQEERFTRKKHDPSFPNHAIEYCLSEGNLEVEQLDFIGFYDKPLLTFDRLLETYLAFAPSGFRQFVHAMPVWLKQKLHLPRVMRKELGKRYRKRFIFTEHHQSHAASAFFPSPFNEAAILTVDGVGEWATATFGSGKGNQIELTNQMRFPHSLGLLYSAFTYYCGFKVNSGEYKLMGLAPYGEPKYVDLIYEKLIDVKEDGSFRMDMQYFNYCQGLTMTSSRLHQLFGGPPRRPESPMTQRDMDIAASIQKVTEDVMLKMAIHVHQQTGHTNLCLAGGVALNCVANGKILREGPFENVWIQPAAGDAGGALGVALFTWFQLLGNERNRPEADLQGASYFGPQFDSDVTRKFLDDSGAVYEEFPSSESLCDRVATLIADEKVVGWMHGRMEFGPRALGGRSILGDARSTKMQSVMNQKIKFRESFRPFAPSVLRDEVSHFFETRDQEDSPYMLLVAPVKQEIRHQPGEHERDLRGIDRLQTVRSDIPAITHVDYSARLQTVDADRHGRYYQLLRSFQEKTGSPVLINTSFNVRGEPIVCTPEHAYRCFMATDMDVLVIGDFLLLKDEQPNAETNLREKYLDQFSLD